MVDIQSYELYISEAIYPNRFQSNTKQGRKSYDFL